MTDHVILPLNLNKNIVTGVTCVSRLTGASLGHSLPGAVSGLDGGQHHLVKRSGPQAVEADARDVGLYALVLDDAAVVDQQEAVGVQLSGRSFPLSLQAVGAAAVRDLQPGDLSRSCQEPPETHGGVKKKKL